MYCLSFRCHVHLWRRNMVHSWINDVFKIQLLNSDDNFKSDGPAFSFLWLVPENHECGAQLNPHCNLCDSYCDNYPDHPDHHMSFYIYDSDYGQLLLVPVITIQFYVYAISCLMFTACCVTPPTYTGIYNVDGSHAASPTLRFRILFPRYYIQL